MSTRTVTAHIEAEVTGPAEIVLSIAAAHEDGAPGFSEQLTVTLDDQAIDAELVRSTYGTRLHLLRDVGSGHLAVDYQADVDGDLIIPAPDHAAASAERILYLRPSRYAESDTLAAVAASEFGGLQGKELLDKVRSWVGSRVSYVPGSSRPTDGAVHTYLAREGVCRDTAHLVVATLRACRVPARLVSVYAPGLVPMDFHAVAEAQIDDEWYVVDGTGLAPRASMLRIATGRDASDTAFLTTHSGGLVLSRMEVTATVSPDLPPEDMTELVQLA